jgi:hypothetical protein
MDLQATNTLAQLRLCAAQDDSVSANDTRRRLPVWIRTPLDTAIATLEAKLQEQGTTEGERSASSNTLQNAYRSGEVLIRDINRYLKALPRSVDQSQARAHYGLQHGLEGELTHAEVEALLQTMTSKGSADSTPPELHLRPADVALAAQLFATIQSHKPIATVGIRASVSQAKDTALDEAQALRSRAYHYLCAALEGGVFDPLLTAYGFDPRDNTGQRLVAGEPGAPPA